MFVIYRFSGRDVICIYYVRLLLNVQFYNVFETAQTCLCNWFMRKVTFGGASSLDNYFARKDDTVDWLMWSSEASEMTRTIGRRSTRS